MTEAAVKNLQLARDAILKNEFLKAKDYYEVVYHENHDDLEAEWFYRFGKVLGEIDSDTADHYVRLADIFYPMLEHLTAYEESELKHQLVMSVVVGFLPMREALHKAMLHKPTSNPDDMVKIELATRVDKETLAERIIELFGDGAPYCFMAIKFWKEMIAERFQWSKYRNFKDKGKELWFDKLAERIKQYDPSYEMPKFKQAGCIASGDAVKVNPGE